LAAAFCLLFVIHFSDGSDPGSGKSSMKQRLDPIAPGINSYT
jgi:hypothetical protein